MTCPGPQTVTTLRVMQATIVAHDNVNLNTEAKNITADAIA